MDNTRNSQPAASKMLHPMNRLRIRTANAAAKLPLPLPLALTLTLTLTLLCVAEMAAAKQAAASAAAAAVAARQFGGGQSFGNALGTGYAGGLGYPGGGIGAGQPGCPLCDASVYGYCSHKLIHDACCCDFPAQQPQLKPPQCLYYDCALLYAKSCYEHALIKNCCCNNPY